MGIKIKPDGARWNDIDILTNSEDDPTVETEIVFVPEMRDGLTCLAKRNAQYT